MDSDEEVPIVTRLAQFSLKHDDGKANRINYDEEPKDKAKVATKRPVASAASAPLSLEERKALEESYDDYIAQLQAELKVGHKYAHAHKYMYVCILGSTGA